MLIHSYNFVGTRFAKNVDLANLKSNVGKLDIDKLKNVPTNLSNLRSKVDKLGVDKLVPVPVDLSKLSDVVKNDVVKKDVNNAKIINIQNIILILVTYLITLLFFFIANLITNTALTIVENKIPKLTAETFAERLAQENVASKNNVAALVKNTDFDEKLKKLNKKSYLN